MLTEPGKFEVTDERVLLTEGPYTGSRTYDAEADHLGVVRKLLDLAILFESAE